MIKRYIHVSNQVILLFLGFILCTMSGARTVVHPKARIIAEGGPIVIGESNLIEEQVVIINRYVSGPWIGLFLMVIEILPIRLICETFKKSVVQRF